MFERAHHRQVAEVLAALNANLLADNHCLRQLATGNEGLRALAREGAIATLTPLDMAASKLLANSDRWADDSVFSRDLIDLAMMQPGKALLQRATDKARLAHGDSIDADLAKAADALLQRPGRMERCMEMLQMTPSVPPALLRKHIKALLPRAPRAKGNVVL
jgi:hypothetical protein